MEARTRAISQVTAYCERNGIADPKHATELIKAAVKHVLGKDSKKGEKVETVEEMDRVVRAILADQFIPDTCELLPI